MKKVICLIIGVMLITIGISDVSALEKYKVVLDNMLNLLSEHEFDDIVSLETVVYFSMIIPPKTLTSSHSFCDGWYSP